MNIDKLKEELKRMYSFDDLQTELPMRPSELAYRIKQNELERRAFELARVYISKEIEETMRQLEIIEKQVEKLYNFNKFLDSELKELEKINNNLRKMRKHLIAKEAIESENIVELASTVEKLKEMNLELLSKPTVDIEIDKINEWREKLLKYEPKPPEAEAEAHRGGEKKEEGGGEAGGGHTTGEHSEPHES